LTDKLELTADSTYESAAENLELSDELAPNSAIDSAIDPADNAQETGRPASNELTVLVVDDSKTIRRSASTLLEDEGWHVVTAEDGFDALGKVVEHQPDVIFADIMMPRLDGYQACALIKNNSRFRDIPVIMLSSKDSIFDKARGRIAGSEHYLTKPFTRRELVRAVVTATRKQTASRQPARTQHA